MRKSVSIPLLVILVIFAALAGGFFTLALGPTVLGTTWESQVAPTAEKTAVEQKSQSSTSSGELSAVEIGEKLSPSVVGVSNMTKLNSNTTGNSTDVEMGIGSGVIIDPRGYIVTNYHVISGGESINVTLSDGPQTAGTIVGTDKRTDLALLKIEGNDFSAAVFGDSDTVLVGESAIAIGNPGGLDFASSVTQGIISGLNRPLTTDEGLRFKLIQTDAAINPGNSGGALVNNRGEVIGINTIKISEEGFEGMGFAIPANLVSDIVQELMDTGKVTRAALGVYLLGSVGREYAVPDGGIDHGVVISVREGGPGAEAGLRENDVITAVDGNEISDIYELQDVIFDHEVGDTIEVTVYRNGATETYPVLLGQLEDE